jgi:hypothetical protein
MLINEFNIKIVNPIYISKKNVYKLIKGKTVKRKWIKKLRLQQKGLFFNEDTAFIDVNKKIIFCTKETAEFLKQNLK